MSDARARIMAFLSSDALRPFFVIVVVFILWQLGVMLFKIPAYLAPTPASVAGQLVSEWPTLWRETLVTTYATLGGFGLSVLFGVPLGLAVVSSRLVESLVYPIPVFSQSVPKVAVAPLFVVWFGFGTLPKVIVAFLLGFFPIVVSTVIGLKSIEPEVLDLARSMKASPLAAFLKIRLPAAGRWCMARGGLSASRGGAGRGARPPRHRRQRDGARHAAARHAALQPRRSDAFDARRRGGDGAGADTAPCRR